MKIIITNLYKPSTPQRITAYMYCGEGLQRKDYNNKKALEHWASILGNDYVSLSNTLNSETGIVNALTSLERKGVREWIAIKLYEIIAKVTKLELSPTSIKLAKGLYAIVSIHALAGHEVIIEVNNKTYYIKPPN